MRLEQRIGRLDRFGQLHDKITIVNFPIPGTIETDIFQRLYDRIGIFKSSIGELEPILGEAMRELERSILSPELTAEQQRTEAERIAVAVENRKRELERFEETRARLVGHDDYVVEQLDEIDRRRRYLTPEEIERLFRGFLARDVGGKTTLTADRDDPRVLYLQASPRLSELLRPHVKQHGAAVLDLLTEMEAGTGITITFHPEVAYRRKLEFLNLRHPVVQGVIAYYERQGRVFRAGRIRLRGEPRGDFLFFVFLLESAGLLERHTLFSVAVNMETGELDPAISDLLLPALAEPELADPDHMPTLHPEVVNRCYEVAEASALLQLQRLKDELERTNTAIAVSRQESLALSLRTRSDRIAETLRSLSEPRIRRMKEAQLRNLEARVEAKIAEIERQKIVNASLEPLAGGYAQVV
jgi:hypothetical protein